MAFDLLLYRVCPGTVLSGMGDSFLHHCQCPELLAYLPTELKSLVFVLAGFVSEHKEHMRKELEPPHYYWLIKINTCSSAAEAQSGGLSVLLVSWTPEAQKRDSRDCYKFNLLWGFFRVEFFLVLIAYFCA